MKVKTIIRKIHDYPATKRYSLGITFITYNRKSNNTMLFSITITIIWWGVVILVER